ncbi:cilia- and flagella-associated protein 251 [Solenopsis invicta]|uniref:cilia- and flagella-associated protein 251 n=1 Tax=Solenopsis invicta TaxID=13686 RepID=UPI00193D121C|nr:cilia- and flagella-associated protein 251 [Solenopsis invicta]
MNKNGDALNCDCPKVMAKFQRVGMFNMSCYVSKMQQVFTACTNGYILVWDNVLYDDKHAIGDNFKKKKHLKTLNLQKSSITVIIDNEGMLVTGNSNGRVTFYDYQLKLLYWCQSCDLDSIRWISFDLQSNLLAPAFEVDVPKNEHQDDSKTETISSTLTVNAECITQIYQSKSTATNEIIPNGLPTDATLQCSPFNVRNFLACSSTGIVALIEIWKQKCHVVFSHPVAATTSIDAHPESNYVVVGDAQGTVHLYDHEKCTLMISRNVPPLPDYQPILKRQITDENIVYVTCLQSHESLKAVTALKFSPKCDMLVCGLENGALWILHHITLDPIDEIPYKHSSTAVNKIAFTRCAEYMAYAHVLTVVVFKRNSNVSSKERNIWNFIGKYHSHYLPIRDILFGSAASDSNAPRFFSLGEDRELIEYDLAHSGPYPVPGLQILHIDQIEQSAIPLCLAWYPKFDNERFLMISNSEVMLLRFV